jgi:hypothetical protein
MRRSFHNQIVRTGNVWLERYSEFGPIVRPGGSLLVGTFSDGADIQTRFPSSKLARSCLINNPKPETPRMRPAIKAGLRSFAQAEKAYMRQLGSVEIPTRVVILSGVWRVLGAKRSRRTCGFSAKSDNIPWDNSRPVEGREHVNKARQLLAKSLRGGCPTCTASCAVKVGYFVSIVFLESR